MKGQTRRYLTIGLSLVGLGMVVGVAIAVYRLQALDAHTGWIIAVVAAALVGVTALWAMFGILDTHFDDLERLRAAVLVASVSSSGRLPPPREESQDDEIKRLRDAVETLMGALNAGDAPDARLSAVLGTLEEGIVVVTDSGQISLLNAAAKAILGRPGLSVGASVFGVLDGGGLVRALEESRKAGASVDWTLTDVEGRSFPAKVADLPGHAGAVIRLSLDGEQPSQVARLRAVAKEVEHDLSLHDAIPEAVLSEDTPLSDLPAFVFDSETTGLDVVRDRMVSFGGVRVHGTRIFRVANVDRLVNPGVPIPAKSTAIHGIDDVIVQDAPTFAEAWPALEPLLRGAVLVGHNIGFDIAILRRECERAGLIWPEPPALDTFLLSGMLFPSLDDLNLESVALRLGVPVHGRHTALGDALVTAEVYVRLVPLLQAAGVTTLAEARSYARKATNLIAKQKAMGW